jgi:hypothetical protein
MDLAMGGHVDAKYDARNPDQLMVSGNVLGDQGQYQEFSENFTKVRGPY